MSKTGIKKATQSPDQRTIDETVISQADDNAAWHAPVTVKWRKSAKLSLPGDLAARAAFLARLHHEPVLDKWVERVVRERVELEEVAFREAKRRLAS